MKKAIKSIRVRHKILFSNLDRMLEKYLKTLEKVPASIEISNEYQGGLKDSGK